MSVMMTSLYAGLLALWYLALSVRVIQRRGHGVSLGHGDDMQLLRRIRGHANFSEYVPLILIMMALLELNGMRAWVLHASGITLLVARILHGVALSFTQNWKFGRFYGTLLTFILLLSLGVTCIARSAGWL